MVKQKDNQCVVLARVSSRAQDEEGYSLDAQEHLADEYCARKNLEVIKLFRITETASKAKERQVFTEMIKYINKSRIRILVVEKADRLTRSFKDMVMIDDWLDVDDKREVHLIKDSLILTKYSRSQDKLNWGVRVLLAKNYTDNLREEVYKGRQEKLLQGWLPGRPPYGYMTIGNKGKKTHIPHPEESILAKKLFEAYLEPSHSLSSVTSYAASIGIVTHNGNPICRSAITDNILKNPFYIGINRWQSIDYPGNQQPIISKSLFDAVQAKMSRKSPPKYQKHDPDLRGMIQCAECGGTISWEFQKGVWYGHCNRYKGCPKKRYAKQSVIEKQLYRHFEALLCPSIEIADWIIESLKKKHQDDVYDHSVSVDTLRQQYDRKKRQLDLLYEDRLSERITPERYDEVNKKIMQEQEEIEGNISQVGTESRGRLITGIDVLEKSQRASKIYETKSPDEKRKLLGELFTSLTLNGVDLKVEYNPYTLAISKRVQKHRLLVDNFRTKENTPDNGGGLELVEALRTVWRARPDSNW